MPHAEVNGAQLYYEERGQGFPLVLSHGGWTDGTMWAPNVGPLARRWRVITWDRRGCGRSSDPGEGHTWEIWRDDLAALLHHLGIERAFVGGNSYGALLSLELALARPELARALVLESGTADGIAGAGPELVEFPPRFDDLHRIAVPALIIQGELDPFWGPQVGERLRQGIAGSELVIARGCAHVPHLEDPALFNRRVDGFLARIG